MFSARVRIFVAAMQTWTSSSARMLPCIMMPCWGNPTAILIGRLAVNEVFADKGVGSELLSLIKSLSILPDNLSDCRFLAVDAKNEEKPLHYYEKNDFVYLYSSEEQEADNLQLEMPLKTRFMFFDLIDLFEE